MYSVQTSTMVSVTSGSAPAYHKGIPGSRHFEYMDIGSNSFRHLHGLRNFRDRDAHESRAKR